VRTEDIRVTVGDDQPLFRNALATALSTADGVEVVAVSEGGEAALAEILRHRPTVAVLDLRRPACDPAAVMAMVIQERLQTRVAILSDSLSGGSVHAALAAGVSACLSKFAEGDELRTAVIRVARGERVVSPSLLNGLLDEIRVQAAPPRKVLSPRERAILELLAAGHNTRQIGQRLHLAQSTVKTYMTRVYEKLQVHGHTAAVVAAIRLGEISDPGPPSSEGSSAMRASAGRRVAASSLFSLPA
jgi:DNA-binding NarL/FixJ family response regulator